MTIKVIGTGLGRTGTASLKQALETLLGGTCHHMFEVDVDQEAQVPVWTAAAKGEMPDWHDFLKNFTAIVDWPGCSFWPEITAAFPDALVILSVRDLDKWYNSAIDTIFLREYPREVTAFDRMWMGIIRDRFCADFTNRKKMIAAATAHQNKVIASIPAERLLVWTVTDGWGPICERLGLPIPNEPFPRTNSKKEFAERFVS
ncbi:MAG: hypothetical protein ACI9EW_000020 [Cellvibrionaceae bacterium]|jgi:hypothetical protein